MFAKSPRKPYVYRYTMNKSNSSMSGYSVYAFVLDWPEDNTLKLGSPQTTNNTSVRMLGYSGELFKWSGYSNAAGLVVKFPFIPPNKLPSYYAWVLKIDSLAN